MVSAPIPIACMPQTPTPPKLKPSMVVRKCRLRRFLDMSLGVFTEAETLQYKSTKGNRGHVPTARLLVENVEGVV